MNEKKRQPYKPPFGYEMERKKNVRRDDPPEYDDEEPNDKRRRRDDDEPEYDQGSQRNREEEVSQRGVKNEVFKGYGDEDDFDKGDKMRVDIPMSNRLFKETVLKFMDETEFEMTIKSSELAKFVRSLR